MKSRTLKRICIVVVAVVFALSLICAIALIMFQMRVDSLHDDWRSALNQTELSEPAQVDGVEAITQDISCGYAVIEMFSTWDGGNITEESLFNTYGKVVTSTGQAFCNEMNKQFPAYNTTMFKYLKDSELLTTVYRSLQAGVPVPIEWAAKCGDEWTLHYSLVIGMDAGNDKVTVANPYGYVEELPFNEFLRRTSFEAYEDMPFYLKLGFAFGVFELNTVFTPERAL